MRYVTILAWLLAVAACAQRQTSTTRDPVAVDMDVKDPDLFDTSQRHMPPTIKLALPSSVLEGVSVSATITVEEGDSKSLNYFYDWDGNGVYEDVGERATAQHVYKRDGTYKMQVRVQDEHKNSATATQRIIVHDAAPTAVFDLPGSMQEGSWVPLDARKSSSAVDAIVKYEWDLSYDGKNFRPSALQGVQVEHRWLKHGQYRVALRVVDSDGSKAIIDHTVEIADATPKAVIAGPSSVMVGEVAIFNGSDSTTVVDPIKSYAWNADVQSNPEGYMPGTGMMRKVWRQPGSYQIGLQVTDSDGSVGRTLQTIAVQALPAPQIDEKALKKVSPKASKSKKGVKK